MTSKEIDLGGTARQKELFESIHNKYTSATTDKFAEAYKEEFIYRPILSQLAGSRSLIELASGVGTASGWMRDNHPHLQISGCDISESACEEYSARHGRPCYLWDLTKPVEVSETFDAVLVMGGIHHLVADLPMAFENISRMLKPGGRLIMAEPNADYVLEPLRKLWYRLDTTNFDANNEHALSHDRLYSKYGTGMQANMVRYIGGPACFILLHNWVLRLPNSIKTYVAPSLIGIERLWHRLPGKRVCASFIAIWQKQ